MPGVEVVRGVAVDDADPQGRGAVGPAVVVDRLEQPASQAAPSGVGGYDQGLQDADTVAEFPRSGCRNDPYEGVPEEPVVVADGEDLRVGLVQPGAVLRAPDLP
ncbi:hypothetical protein PYK79_45570 [Streptomyces sp. ID05-04B]|nr:hypothetical protein [Streptomyces sp. ID05-04B]MDX5569101.1 hypothetical protein [Streptomyces sp. ID05-04B]